MRLRSLAPPLVALLLASGAEALDVGSPLWAGPLGATVFAKASTKSKVAIKVAAGDELVWLGPSPSPQGLQRVRTVAGVEGFALLAELVPRRPVVEVTQAPGVAVEAFAPPLTEPGPESGSPLDGGTASSTPGNTRFVRVARDLATARAVARSVSTPEALSAVMGRAEGAK